MLLDILIKVCVCVKVETNNTGKVRDKLITVIFLGWSVIEFDLHQKLESDKCYFVNLLVAWKFLTLIALDGHSN